MKGRVLFPLVYVEGLNDAKTKLADLFSILLDPDWVGWVRHTGLSMTEQEERRRDCRCCRDQRILADRPP